MTKQELDSSKDYTNSETKPMKKSVNTTTTKVKPRITNKERSQYYRKQSYEGLTLTEILKDKSASTPHVSA